MTSQRPSVSPVLPLLLLETMRDRDRPEEVLEEEDITLSLPRRFGLSEVVRVQISKYTEEVSKKRPQVASQVEDLFRLVIKRPDAEDIFQDAGERIARRFWEERSGWNRKLGRLLPGPLGMFWAQRAARRMFADLVGPTRMRIIRKPLALRIDRSLTATADPGGEACAFYSGALAEVLRLVTGRQFRVQHRTCAARDHGGPCEWTVETLG